MVKHAQRFYSDLERVGRITASRSMLRFNVEKPAYGSGQVKPISPRGEVTVVSESPLPWGPTGGMVSPAGDLWILERSILNDVRLKRISRNGSVRYY